MVSQHRYRVAGRLLVTAAALGALLAVSACGGRSLSFKRKSAKVTFDGQTFRTRTDKLGDDRLNFQVKVPQASKSIDGAREAGRHGGVKYCIRNYGSSDIIWTKGPDAEEEPITVKDDTLIFEGRCLGW